MVLHSTLSEIPGLTDHTFALKTLLLIYVQLMGLAVYNGIILDIHFPPICYKKLLSPAVVPFNDVNAVVGVLPVTLDDLRQMSPVSSCELIDCLYNNKLQWWANNELFHYFHFLIFIQHSSPKRITLRQKIKEQRALVILQLEPKWRSFTRSILCSVRSGTKLIVRLN